MIRVWLNNRLIKLPWPWTVISSPISAEARNRDEALPAETASWDKEKLNKREDWRKAASLCYLSRKGKNETKGDHGVATPTTDPGSKAASFYQRARPQQGPAAWEVGALLGTRDWVPCWALGMMVPPQWARMTEHWTKMDCSWALKSSGTNFFPLR